ncbi:MAG: ATP synthase F0 subunit B [Myxococcota bacterium]|nr:ATP synthase F0 subunit B [Myxococcota bacterium]
MKRSLLILVLLAFASPALGQEPTEPATEETTAAPRPAPAQAQPPAEEPAEAPAARPAPTKARPAPTERPQPLPRLVAPPAAQARPTAAEAPAEEAPAAEAEVLEQAIEDAPEFEEVTDEEMDAVLFGDEEAHDHEHTAVEELVEETAGEPIDVDDGHLEDAVVAHGEEGHGEHAAEHGEEHHPAGIGTLLAPFVNFVLWAAILFFLFRKPLTEFLANRRRSVEEGLVEAKRLKEEAEAKYEEYSERLERLDVELDELRKEMVHAAESERDRILADANARSARMRKDAQFLIDQQMKQLKSDLTKEAIEAAIAAAEKVMVEQIGGADQERLADQYMTTIQQAMKDEEARA